MATCMRLTQTRGQAACLQRPRPFSSHATRLRAPRAAANDSNVTETKQYKVPPTLEWTEDTESAADVMAFSGPAPERVNGRVAMIGFAGAAAAELSTHEPVLEQLGHSWFTVSLFMLSISVASIIPKLVSGVSLRTLHEQATTPNMTGEGAQAIIGLFDTGLELWTGRIAMLGFLGLVVAEAIKGGAFF